MTDDRQRRECKESFTRKTAADDNRFVLKIQIPRKCKENERRNHEFMILRGRGSLTENLEKKKSEITNCLVYLKFNLFQVYAEILQFMTDDRQRRECKESFARNCS